MLMLFMLSATTLELTEILGHAVLYPAFILTSSVEWLQLFFLDRPEGKCAKY